MQKIYPKTFYLIDDDSDDLEFFCEAVSSIDESIICIKSTSSELSLASFKQHDIPVPDLIFLDLNMPAIDGRTFLSEIKQVKPYAQVPIIVYSTSSHPRDIEETIELGAANFMTQPYTMKALITDLSGVLDIYLNNVLQR